MKALSIEQKAKAYDEALAWMRDLYPTMEGAMKEDAEHYFPELKEEADDRVRNEIIAFVEQSIHRGGGTPIPEEQENKWIAWLERQGSQILANSAKTCKDAWSEEDEERFRNCHYILRAKGLMGVTDTINSKWLESLRDKIIAQSQTKQEWSDEDYNEIETIACHLDNIGNEGMAEALRNIRDKYCHIIPQNR